MFNKHYILYLWYLFFSLYEKLCNSKSFDSYDVSIKNKSGMLLNIKVYKPIIIDTKMYEVKML